MNRKACTVFLVLLASVVSLSLAACGGGGGTRQPVPTSGDEMTITPPNDGATPAPGDSANAPQNATPITSEETIEGYLYSPDDIDYFRVELNQPGTTTVTLNSELSGVEVSVLDAEGNVLASGKTASPVQIAVTTLSIVVLTVKVAFAESDKEVVRTLLEEAVEALGKYALVINTAIHHPSAGQEEKVRIKRDAQFVGLCRCLAIVEPGGQSKQFDLTDYIESPVGSPLRFYPLSQIPDGLTVDLDHSTGRLTVSAPRGAALGIRKFEVKVDDIETSDVFTVKVNVSAVPRLMPGEGTIKAAPGRRTAIDLDDVIGPPENIGSHPPILFLLDQGTAERAKNVRRLRARIESRNLLVFEPLTDLQGEFFVRVSAWFPSAEHAKEFLFTVTIGGPPQQIAGTDLSVSVQQGGAVMLRLTDYIEDPAGGALTFAHGSLPAGFGVTTDEADWTIATQSTVTPDDYTITVTATNKANQSEDFSLQVAVTGEGEDLGPEWLRADNVDCHAHVSNKYRFRSGTYSGECHERKTHGQGTWTNYYYRDGLVDQTYVGGWREGLSHGQGTWTNYNIADGSVYQTYVGGWREGQEHGQGTKTLYNADGSVSRTYVGGWREGQEHGQGTETSYNADGSVSRTYVGGWSEGSSHGQGTETSYNADGSVSRTYVGGWSEGSSHGQGTETSYNENGSVLQTYVGGWREGHPHKGILTFPVASVFIKTFGHVTARLVQEGEWQRPPGGTLRYTHFYHVNLRNGTRKAYYHQDDGTVVLATYTCREFKCEEDDS